MFIPNSQRIARTTLRTQVDAPLNKIEGGEYSHFGLAKGLLAPFEMLDLPANLHSLKLQFNIDVLLLFRSSKLQFRLILALVSCDYSKSPFIVVICGINEPKSMFEYLSPFTLFTR